MIVRRNMFGSLVKPKSHMAMAPSARRKHCAGDCRNLMRHGVSIAVESVVDHIIDTGCGYLFAGREFFYFLFHFFFPHPAE